MPAATEPEALLALARSPYGAIRLIELLSLCDWNVVIRRHPAGGLEAAATRGFARVTVAASSLGELGLGIFLACMRCRSDRPDE